MVFYFLHTEIKDQRRKTFSLRSSIFPGEIEKDLKRKLCKLLKKNKNCLHVYCWLDQCDATLKTNPSFGTSITRLRRFPSQPSYRPLKCESSTSHFNTHSHSSLSHNSLFHFLQSTTKVCTLFFCNSSRSLTRVTFKDCILVCWQKKKVTQFSYLYLCCALVCLLDVLFHCQIVLQIYVYQTWQNLETCCVRWELTSLPG